MWAAHGVTEEDRLDRGEAKQVLRRAARLARPYRRLALATLGFVIMATSTTIAGPLLLRYGIDEGIRGDDAGALNLAIGLYIAVAILAYAGGRQQYVFVNRTGEGFLRSLRLRLFAHIQRQSLAFFDRNKAGVLVSRMTADIESTSAALFTFRRRERRFASPAVDGLGAAGAPRQVAEPVL